MYRGLLSLIFMPVCPGEHLMQVYHVESQIKRRTNNVDLCPPFRTSAIDHVKLDKNKCGFVSERREVK